MLTLNIVYYKFITNITDNHLVDHLIDLRNLWDMNLTKSQELKHSFSSTFTKTHVRLYTFPYSFTLLLTQSQDTSFFFFLAKSQDTSQKPFSENYSTQASKQ